MKIAVLGTGNVGETIASKIVSLGHDVKMGARKAGNEKAVAWTKKVGSAKASEGSFADAASFAEIVFHCTAGSAGIEALSAAGANALRGKIVVDVSNPLDMSKGFPPTLSVVNDDSLGERIQRAFPETKVVKTLNTVNCALMVEPGKLNNGDHTMFIAGDDAAAKKTVTDTILREWFGWKDVLDLGPISMARGMEMYLPLWVRMYGAIKSPHFNVKVVR